jgi:hypothetical protein
VRLQLGVQILYFASAALLYEFVIVPSIEGAPSLGLIIGVISKSTGSMMRYFVGSSLLAALYSYGKLSLKGVFISSSTGNEYPTVVEEQSLVSKSPNTLY